MPGFPCRLALEVGATPFGSAQDAWFWAISALAARSNGESSHNGGSRLPRPCEPDDVIRCLIRLYQESSVGEEHARVLRRWGKRQVAPDPRHETANELRLWQEALSRLTRPLRDKGIVAAGQDIGKHTLTAADPRITL